MRLPSRGHGEEVGLAVVQWSQTGDHRARFITVHLQLRFDDVSSMGSCYA